VNRKLTAILCADVYGYGRLMGEDEEATLRTLSAHRKIIDSLIEQHHGRFVNSAGDSVLAEYASVVNAVQCAVDVQAALKTENASLPTQRRMEFRIGVNLGDVMVEGEQIYGDGVNVAARLESLAEPGGICISGTVYDHVSNKLGLSYADLGEQAVKNIAKPVRVFRVSPEGTVAPLRTRRIPRRYWRGGVLSLSGLAIVIATIFVVQHVSLKPPHSNASIPPAQSPALPLPDKPSIAVLPFINMSGDHDQEYFSDGITDDLITDLSRLPGLFVIARDSTFTYKGKAAKLQDVGRELGVKYVLEGSVRKAASQIRITVQLADATTGGEIWAERYDRPLRDVFALQDEIVRRIVTTLNLELALSQQGYLVPRTTKNLEAYDNVLRGMEYLVSLTKGGTEKARPLFEKAIELDSNYAVAYALMGFDYWISSVLGFSPDPGGLGQALKMEQQAIAIDDAMPFAHSTMAEIDTARGLHKEALSEAQRAIALDPNSAAAYQALSEILNEQARPAEALVAVSSAIRLDPRNSDNHAPQQGYANLLLGRYEESIPPLKRYLARHPDDFWDRAWLAHDYSFLGKDDAARAEAVQIEAAVALARNSAFAYRILAFTRNSLWKPADALVAADAAIRLDPSPSSLFQRGRAYTLLGRPQEAIPAIEPFAARYPDDFYAHAYLAVDYMEVGRDEAARAEAAEVLRLYPEFSVDIIFPTASSQAKVLGIDRFRADLNKAGLK
jgi:adenylate cyclase